MRQNDKKSAPLSPALFHILMALVGQDRHGYAIMQEISRQTDGSYTLGPGTLYDNLQKVIRRRWVLDLGHRPGDVDPRRRFYQPHLTRNVRSRRGSRSVGKRDQRRQSAPPISETKEGLMFRSLFRLLVSLHPRAFRERFAGEMLSIFDHSDGKMAALGLVADAFLSLLRQWGFRPAFWNDGLPPNILR